MKMSSKNFCLVKRTKNSQISGWKKKAETRGQSNKREGRKTVNHFVSYDVKMAKLPS